MPLKPTVHFNGAAEGDRQAWYTVVCYPGMRGESSSIVDSNSISKAIVKVLARSEPIIAIAHNFTSEALEILDQH